MSDANTFQQEVSGQEVRRGDVNSMAQNGGQAVDRALWELFRLTPPDGSTPDRGIIPYGVKGGAAYTGLSSTATVQGGTADAKVRVMPFRAVIGSTATLADPYEDNLRGQRSAYAIGSSFFTEITIAANASGDPRWDLIYATVTPDEVATSESVLVKNGSTPFAVAPQTRDTFIKTSVVIARQAGTPGAAPAYPTKPADGAGGYTIALAHVYVPNGFGAASTVQRQHIREIAPVLSLHEATGGISCSPANSLYDPNGAVEARQNGNEPTGPNYYAPTAFLPSTMQGAKELIVAINLQYLPVSHNDADIVDDSIDWRFRIFTWTAYVKAGATVADSFVWDRGATGGALVPGAIPAAQGGEQGMGWGQSFDPNDAAASTLAPTDHGGFAAHLRSADYSNLGSSKVLALYVNATTGALHIKFTSGTTGQTIIWLRASAQFSNFGTV